LGGLVPINLAIVHQACDEHTLTCISTSVNTPNHLIPDQCNKSVPLIINLIKRVFPKGVENGRGDEKSTHGHPKTVREGGESESDYEDGEYS